MESCVSAFSNGFMFALGAFGAAFVVALVIAGIVWLFLEWSGVK